MFVVASDNDSEKLHLKLADFGLCRSFAQNKNTLCTETIGMMNFFMILITFVIIKSISEILVYKQTCLSNQCILYQNTRIIFMFMTRTVMML